MSILVMRKLILSLLIVSVSSLAQVNLPPVNLGATSFQDGRAGPGTLVQETFSVYSAEQFTDNQGDNLAVDSHLYSYAATTMIAHFTEYKILGGYYGFEALLPVVKLDVDLFDHNKKSALGDLIVSPFMLQWNESKLFGLPLYHRVNFVFNLPTGSYGENKPLNIGSNALSFNPYYALTLQVTPRIDTSIRMHYLWNDKNDSPVTSSAADSTQAGQAFHINYASSYQVSDNIRLGIAGYYLKQFTQDRENGIRQMHSKESVFAIGLGFHYSKKGFTVAFNAYKESAAKNRPEGDKFNLRIAQVF